VHLKDTTLPPVEAFRRECLIAHGLASRHPATNQLILLANPRICGDKPSANEARKQGIRPLNGQVADTTKFAA